MKIDRPLNTNYIVEEGSNADGCYRKWNNGDLEMWGAKNLENANINVAAGSLYHSSGYTFDLPYASLTNVEGVSLIYASTGLVVPVLSTGGNSKTTIGYWLCAPTSFRTYGTMHFRCTGTWK